MRRCRIAAALVVMMLAAVRPAFAQISDNVVRIGILGDMTGPNSQEHGPGDLVAARLAVEDFGGTVHGAPIQIIGGNLLGGTDIGVGIARQWFDSGVDMIVDLPNTAVALAVQNLARDRHRVAIVVTAAGSSLTGSDCTPNSLAWVYNTRALADVVGQAMTAQGGATWFLLSTDYTFGREMEADLRTVLQAHGAKLLGTVAAPQETSDFSSFLLQAQASGAKVVGLANVASDTINSIKQAHEFGLIQGGQRLAALLMTDTDVKSLGLPTAGGLYFATAWYWDRTPETRAWAQRFYAKHGAMPTALQAGVYSAVTQYLKAIAAKQTKAAQPVLEQMRATPVDDVFTHDGHIRPDGLMAHDMYLAQVKMPDASHSPWDLLKIVGTVPAERAFGPLSESKCPLAKVGQ